MLEDNPQRAVLDTNLVVRVLISPSGVTSRLFAALTEKAFQFATSEILLGELVDVLRSPRLQKHALCCALESEAGYIVTDDRRDLLPLKVVRCAGYRPVQIVSPLAFLRLLGQ